MSKKTPDVIWWNGSDLAGFFAAVCRRGAENVRIELRLDHEDYAKSRLHILQANGEGFEALSHGEPCDCEDPECEDPDCGYNFAHPCPPECD